MNLIFRSLFVLSVLLLSACGAQEAELNVKLNGEGRITSPAGVDCSEPCVTSVKILPPFIGNKHVKITATPAPGYQFLGWNHHSCSADAVCNLEYSGLCRDQIFCSTGLVYFEQQIKPVFVNSALLLDSAWSERAICAAFSSGIVQCWAHSFLTYVETVPALNNPQQVAVGGDVACAQVDEGVHCWGHPNLIPQDAPVLYPPLEMAMLSSTICVLDQEGVKCWNRNGFKAAPEFIDPANLRTKRIETPELLGERFCVDDVGGEVCW